MYIEQVRLGHGSHNWHLARACFVSDASLSTWYVLTQLIITTALWDRFVLSKPMSHSGRYVCIFPARFKEINDMKQDNCSNIVLKSYTSTS